jgi:hypothetical protein
VYIRKKKRNKQREGMREKRYIERERDIER